MPPLIDPHRNIAYYTDHDKAEAIAKYFVNIHNSAHSNSSSLDDKIKRPCSITNSPSETDAHPPHHINVTPHQIHNLIKKLLDNKDPGPDKITATLLKKPPEKGNSTDLLRIQKLHSKFLLPLRLKNSGSTQY